MGSASLIRVLATRPLAPAADYSAKKGYMVTDDGTTATLSGSATVPATGLIIEPNKGTDYTKEKVTVLTLGGSGTVPMKTSGVIGAGARVQQAADGTIVTDAGPGNARVVIGVAMEAAASGDIIEVAPLSPMILP